MAGGLHKFTVAEAENVGLGQTGNAFVDDTDKYEPPDGTVIIAITMLSNANFTELTPESTSFWCGNASSPGTNGTAVSTDSFPNGVTIYGRWLSFTLQTSTSDRVLCYFAP